MKHLEVRQKYSAALRIFNSLLGVSSGDETLRRMLDILRVAHGGVGTGNKRRARTGSDVLLPVRFL